MSYNVLRLWLFFNVSKTNDYIVPKLGLVAESILLLLVLGIHSKNLGYFHCHRVGRPGTNRLTPQPSWTFCKNQGITGLRVKGDRRFNFVPVAAFRGATQTKPTVGLGVNPAVSTCQPMQSWRFKQGFHSIIYHQIQTTLMYSYT